MFYCFAVKAEIIISSFSIVLVIIQSLYSIMFALYQLHARKIKNYFWDLINYTSDIWLQIAICPLVIIFSSFSIYNAVNDEIHSKAMWQVGIFAIIFAWANLIILGSKFPTLGEYALIFISILRTFLELMVFGFILVLASTIVLRMIFYSPLQLVS